jgi:hypothetical protein
MCGEAGGRPAPRLGPKRLLKIAAAVAVACGLMYVETWAIEQAPLWSSACILRPATAANGANSDAESPLRDTAGPVAVLH